MTFDYIYKHECQPKVDAILDTTISYYESCSLFGTALTTYKFTHHKGASPHHPLKTRPRLYLVRISAASRPHLGRISAASRPHLGARPAPEEQT